MVNILRADQRSVTLMKYQVLKKYLGLGCLFGGLLLISKSLRVFYSASVVAEGTALVFLTLDRAGSYPDRRPTPKQFSWPLYRELLSLRPADDVRLRAGRRDPERRRPLRHQGQDLARTQLGLYSAAYNLCQYVQTIFITSVGQASDADLHEDVPRRGRRKDLGLRQSVAGQLHAGRGADRGGRGLGRARAADVAGVGASTRSAGGVLLWVIAGMVIDGACARSLERGSSSTAGARR